MCLNVTRHGSYPSVSRWVVITPRIVRAGRLGELVKRESWQLEEMKIPNAVSTCPYSDENCDFSLLSRTWTLVNSCFPIGLNIPW